MYRILICLLGFVFLCIHCVQFYKLRVAYVEDFWKLFLLASLILNLYCILEHTYDFSGISYDTMVEISSVAVAIQWSLFYYWFRLVPGLAFYLTFLT